MKLQLREPQVNHLLPCRPRIVATACESTTSHVSYNPAHHTRLTPQAGSRQLYHKLLSDLGL